MSRGGWAALLRGATGCLQFVIVVFPDHTHLLFLNLCMLNILCFMVSFADLTFHN